MLHHSIGIAVAFVLLVGCSRDSDADSQPENPQPETVELTTREVTQSLTFPWEIVWGSDNFIWLTERGGKISRVDPTNGNVSALLTLGDISAQGEGGLLGMVLHPDFSTSPQVFVAYTYMKSGNYTEKVVRFTYNGTVLANPQIILDDIKAANIHNGCRLAISQDNKLFVSTGDASDQSLPQNVSSINGKILRVNLDGSIPSDNPNPSSPIWSSGHRNAQGLVFVSGTLFSSEHGPDSDDEINIITKGGNFGWPDVKGKCDGSEMSFCDANNVVEPLISWTPTIAVSGMDYYNHNEIPQWKNSLLVATLKGSSLRQLALNSQGSAIEQDNRYFENVYGRLRDVCISPAGKVYVCTSNGNNDRIVEIGRKN